MCHVRRTRKTVDRAVVEAVGWGGSALYILGFSRLVSCRARRAGSSGKVVPSHTTGLCRRCARAHLHARGVSRA